MRGLAELVRIEQQKLERERKKLADLEELAVRYRAQLESITREIHNEAGTARQFPDTAHAFGPFVSAALSRKRSVQAGINSVRQQIDQAKEDVAAAYRELKKFELAHQHEVEATALKLRRREQATLDELALRPHQKGGQHGSG